MILRFGLPFSGSNVRHGFSLVELLVVMGIIGALAALIAGMFRASFGPRMESRAKAERDMLIGAIEAYKNKFGFYPPDNQKDSALPPLYYELVGWSGTQQELNGVKTAFGVDGFVNSDPERKNFLSNLKSKGFAAIPSRSPQTFVLTFPAIGPAGEFNTWNYRSTKPTNNTVTYDLWLHVIRNSKTNTICNWKE